MKNNSRILTILFAVSLTAIFVGTAQAQYLDYGFVVIETTVTKQGVETSDKKPTERRFYVSSVVEFSEADASVFRSAGKLAAEYFIANVVEPMKAKGILHKYYDDGIKINNNDSYVETRPDVEDLRKKILEDLKEQNANVFTFYWTRDKNVKGLESSQPTLLYRGSEQPLYGAGEQEIVPKKSPVEKQANKIKKKS